MKKLDKLKNTSYRVRTDGRIELRFYRENKQRSIYGFTQEEVLEKFKNWKPKTKKKVKENKTITFKEYFEYWIELFLSKRIKTERTLNGIINPIKNYTYPLIENKKINLITTEDLQIIANRMENVIRQRTIVFNYLNQCFKKAFKTSKIKYNPCEDVEFKKVNAIEEGKAMTVNEQNKFVTYCSKNYNKKTLIYLLYLSTGLRPSELTVINGIKDVDHETSTLHIKGTKTKKADSEIIFPKQTIDLIPKETKPFNFSLKVLNEELENICKSLNIQKFTLKDLRTTFATRCEESGMSPKLIQYYLRHTSTKTSEIFSKILNKNKNNVSDATIATTAIINNCILLTDDTKLYNKMKENNYAVLNFDELKNL